MKFLSFIAALLAVGSCYAGTTGPVRGECGRARMCCHHQRGWHNGWHKPGRGAAFWRPVMGRAILAAPAEPIEVVVSPLTSLTSRTVYGVEYKDGVFTALRDGTYFIRFFAKISATAGDAQSFIKIGVFVKDTEAKTLVLPYVAVPGNAQYPASFRGKDGFSFVLKAGDTVSLRVMEINLPAEAKAYFISNGQEDAKLVAGLFLRSCKKPMID